MGDVRRRRLLKEKAEGVEKFRAEAWGVAEMYVIRRDSDQLIRSLVADDAAGWRFAGLIFNLLNALDDPDLWPGGTPLCATCSQVLSKRKMAAAILQLPYGKDWEHESSGAIASGVCQRCADGKSDDQLCEEFVARWKGQTLDPKQLRA